MGPRSRHVFANPAGRVFALVTVAAAPGAFAIGAPTFEHTWFPGHPWRVALCRGCHGHVGWCFEQTDGSEAFWGLWLDALRQADQARGDSAPD